MQSENFPHYFSHIFSKPDQNQYFSSPEVAIIKVPSSPKSPNNGFFAIKTVSSSNELLLNSLKNESQILSSLQHEAIIQYIDSSFERENSYLVLEWMDTNLHKLIGTKIKEKKVFSKEEIEGMILCLVSGLVYLRTQRIFHGDLKPSNILFSHEKKFKIADFGSAFDFKNKNENVCGTYYIGTPNYWPPEFRRGFLKNDVKIEYNAFKVDSFMLAFTILISILMKQPNEVYSLLEEKKTRSKLFDEVERLIGFESKLILRKMLKFDSSKRESALEILFNNCINKKNTLLKTILIKEFLIERKNINDFKFLQKQTENIFVAENRKNKKSFYLHTKDNLNEEQLYWTIKGSISPLNGVMNPISYDFIVLRKGFYKCYLIYDTNEKISLHDEILVKSSKKEFYSFEELIKIIYTVAQTVSLLKSSMKNCLIDLNHILKDTTSHKNNYVFLPEEVNDASEDEVFSLGVALLSLCTLKEIKRKQIEEKELKELFFFDEERIDFILNLYDSGDFLVQLLLEMIKFNDYKRISLKDLLEKLFELNKMSS